MCSMDASLKRPKKKNPKLRLIEEKPKHASMKGSLLRGRHTMDLLGVCRGSIREYSSYPIPLFPTKPH